MTSEDSRGGDSDGADGGKPDEATASPSSSVAQAGDDEVTERTPRPLLAGVIGLLAGLIGGVGATAIAPESPLVTTLLVVVLIVGVTLGALQLLAR